MNNPAQPNVCRVCGERIKKSEGDAQYHFDHVRGEHWSKHNKCKEG